MAIPARDRLGRYELRGMLGRGAMGSVYRAWDPELGRAVAIKVIQSPDLEPDLLSRFRREAQALASLSHPNIVAIHDIGAEADAPFIVMELVDGLSLAETIRQGVFYSTEDKLRVMAEVCAALDCAHAARILHRDVKPANILIAAGHAKLVDFGLARLQDVTQTRTGTLLGTPAYLAPEAWLGRPVDARADVYGVAVSLYEWLCGYRPHVAQDSDRLMALVVNHDAPDIRQRWAACPPALARCLQRGLARDPDARVQTARELGEALRSILAPPVLTSSVMDAPTLLMPADRSAVTRSASSRWRRPRTLVAGSCAAGIGLWAALGGGRAPALAPEGPAPRPAPTAATADAPPVLTAPPLSRSHVERRMAPRPSTPASPVTAPVPSAQPSAPAPAESDEEPLALPAAVPVGTRILTTISTELRTDRARPGQTFDARLADAIVWNGREVAPRDAQVRGIVDAVVAGRSGEGPSLELSLSEIVVDGRPVRVRTARYAVVAPSGGVGSGRITTLVIGAALGAAVGGAVGGQHGVVVGAAAGAAASSALPSGHASEGVYVFGNQLTFKLVEPLRISP